VKIVGFVEGARRGSPGVVGVPMILRSATMRGHRIILLMGGPPSLGSEQFIVSNSDTALARKDGNGTFGIVNIKASSDWSFCPTMLWRFSRLVREADVVTLHSLYSFPVLAGYLLARLHRKPYAIWPHGVLAPFQRTVSAQKKWIYNKLFADHILKNASVILYSAEGERKETEALHLRAPSALIPDGFDPEAFAVLPKRGAFRNRFFKGYAGPLVLFLARLSAKKGVDLLIQAMQRVIAERPDVRLAIVGPPDPSTFTQQAEEWIKESGIEAQTVLTGPADPQMRLEAFADADVYVLPSHAENFGFTVFEAMACGVPVVVSETLNFAADFVQGGAGYALPRTPEDFSAAILKLVNQPDLRQQMGSCGRALVHKYSPKETGAKVASALESILAGHSFPADLVPVGTPSKRH
jgi:glycosyltransferase involved in cell wall biosynthesis